VIGDEGGLLSSKPMGPTLRVAPIGAASVPIRVLRPRKARPITRMEPSSIQSASVLPAGGSSAAPLCGTIKMFQPLPRKGEGIIQLLRSQ
jgi:hypothetical protein